MAEQNLVFSIYNEDGSSYNGLSLHKSTYTSVVMSLDDKIEGDFYYKDNSLVFTFKEYIVYNNVRYYLKLDEPPTIVCKAITDESSEYKGMTKYSVTFYHPMIFLYNIPFTDVAVSNDDLKYKSNDTTFYWIGTITAFAAKVNKCLQGTGWTCSLQSGFVDDGTQSDVIQFDNQMISDVLKTGYETWKVPFVIDGYNILFGKPSNEILVEGTNTPYIFELGQGLGLKNNDRTPKNNKVITRIAGYGSDENIPNGYPKIPWTGNQTWKYTVNNDANAANSYPIIDGVINGVTTKLINHPFTRKYLMPTVYTDCVNKKVNPLANGYNPDIELVTYYDAINDANHTYTNQINPSLPSYEKHQFEKIKPSIVGAKYNNQEIDILKTISWINDDGTSATNIDDTYDSNTGKYNQSYFKVSFYPLGFDLYAMAAVTSAMSVNMTGGACNGCKFELGVDWDVVKTNFYFTKEDGTVVFDPTNVYGNHRDYTKFPDSTNTSISVILKKDNNTFGTIMPNIYQQPIIGDKFVFIGIDLPQSYITNKQAELDEASKQYMIENNVAYYEYPFDFDNYFLTNNQYILGQIKTNCIVRFKYGTDTLALSVKEYSIQWGDSALPTYKITLTDDVSISLNQVGQVADGLSKLGSQVVGLQTSYNVNIIDELSKRVSKVYDDTVNGNINFKQDITVGGKTYLQSIGVNKIPYNGISGLTDSPLTVNSTNITSAMGIVAPTFSGELIGNAATATQLKNTRKIFGNDFNGLSDVNGLLTAPNGGLFYGQGAFPTNVGPYVLNYVSPTNGARVLAYDGSSYKDLKLGSMPTAGVFGVTLSANGDTRIGYNIGTSNFSSHTTGWNVNAQGAADFRNIYADELRVQAFTADISQALAGSDYLTKSVSKLSSNFVIPAVGSSVRIIVDDLEGMPATRCFANGDYIRFRAINRTAGLTVANAWGTVTLDTTFGTNGFSNGTQAYTFTCTATSGDGLTVFKGSEVLDYGTSGSGLIARTTLDAMGSPYEQIATWQTDPSNGNNYTVHARLGNLGGIANCSGYGLYTDNGFFTGKIIIGDLTKSGNYLSFDNVNGLQIKLGGTSVATTTDIIIPCGNWESGTSYLKNSLVTFNNQTFVSTINTSDCPIVVLTDESGNYLTDENGSFITPTDENGNVTYNPSWKYYSSSEALENDVAKFKKETSATFEIFNDEIDSKVSSTTFNSLGTRVGTAESNITQNANAITTKVSQTDFDSLGTRVGTAESNITQNANAITTKVSSTDYNGNNIASLINQTATTIQIQASKINLVGAVTFNSFTSDVQNTINGKADSAAHGNFTYIDGNSVYTGTLTANQVNAVAISASSIKTGTLSADRIAANSLDASKIVANTITSTQIDATSVAASIATVISLDAGRIQTGKLSADRIDVVNVVAKGLSAQTINANNATISNLNVTNAKVSGYITASVIGYNASTVNNGLVNGCLLVGEGNYILPTLASGKCVEYTLYHPMITPTTTFARISGQGEYDRFVAADAQSVDYSTVLLTLIGYHKFIGIGGTSPNGGTLWVYN